ncbi:hypothetical protein HYALB_00003081 [Hymenoscyphus albidus]|uniref:SnoaL-like domain-containing protein n=1 Tax=Hymenoscyphus albidus TaxID=595503 RepID=A0A9N9Q0J0_9HELO|nr:hypothetical protein HYALB_00003081 [Hymenoscyphus albidus]
MSSALSPREAVADALYRCILGIDSNDHALFESACLKDESMAVVAGSITIEGWTAINDFFQKLFSLVTTHATSNPRIELKDGADTAFMTCHAFSYHIRPDDAFLPEDTSYTASSLYSLDLVRHSEDGLWRTKKWVINTLWTTGDIKILHG